MNGHPVLKFLAISAACEINDRHNEQMLLEGRYIPWWKRHLLLTITLGLLAPFILIGAFIALANAIGPSVGTAIGQFLGWVLPFVIIGLIAQGYRHAERRWRRSMDQPTKVVDVHH